MRCLLDTHTFLWWIADDPRLPSRTRAVIKDANNQIWFSAASAWEIAIKASLGRITFQADPAGFVPQQVAANGFENLPIRSEHALYVLTLPALHRDPFDRILVAQALVEGLVLLTDDRAIARYQVQVDW